MQTKQCTACKCVLSIDNFYVNVRYKDDREAQCKRCSNAKKRCLACRRWLSVKSFCKARTEDGLFHICKYCCAVGLGGVPETIEKSEYSSIKMCSVCKKRLKVSDFYRVNQNSVKRRYCCKVCDKERSKNRYQELKTKQGVKQ